MESFSEALYNEKRNAIPSWQGYHYQAMVAVYKYLEFIWDKFENKKVVPEQVIVKIEWMEDFVIQDKENIKEIYQVKKTLTNANRKEVLQNFILQYKLMEQENIQWKIVFDQPDQDMLLSEAEFNQVYEEYIEEKFICELSELEKNINDAEFWNENLKLNNKASKLKTIRSYINKWASIEKYDYASLEGRKCIFEKCIKVVGEKLVKRDEDYNVFAKKLEFISCQSKGLEKECKSLIEKLSRSNPNSKPYIEKNNMLSETDILDKLYCKIYSIMMRLNSKQEGDKFFLSLQDLKEVFMDTENTNYKWERLLWEKREEFLEKMKEDFCDDCRADHGEQCDDEDCIIGTVKNWSMKEVIDNMSLELPLFKVVNVKDSITNKISDDKLRFLQEVFEDYRKELELIDRKVLKFRDKKVFLSSVISGAKGKVKKRMKTDIMNNFWEHIEIYKDYDNILTKEFQDEIQRGEIKSIIQKYEKKDSQREHPSFMDISKVSFITEVK